MKITNYLHFLFKSFVLATISCSSVANANLINDPSFEGGTTNGLWGGSVITKSNVFQGVAAAELKQTSASGGGYQITITNLLPSTSYRFTAMVRSSGGTASIGVKNHGNPQKGLLFSNIVYESRLIEFYTGIEATSATVYVWNNPGDAQTVWLDDLLLVQNVVDDPNPMLGYELIFSDEFNDDGPINLKKWSPEIGFKRNNEEQYYRAENLTQSGGNLIITAKREAFENAAYDPAGDNWRTRRKTAQWTSGSIFTRDSFSFLYGKIVCRAKVTNLLGTWPAIWTVGADNNISWPSNGEIDIMENYGGQILANFATANSGMYRAKWDAAKFNVAEFKPNWADDFHIWELNWSPNLIEILLDGIVLNTFDPATKNNVDAYSAPGVAPFQTYSQFLWLNLAIGGQSGGDSSALPDSTSYLVDYIRVYQKSRAKAVLDIKSSGDENILLEINQAQVGRFYQLQESENLQHWTNFELIRANNNMLLNGRIRDILSPKKFYRIRKDNTSMIDSQTPATKF